MSMLAQALPHYLLVLGSFEDDLILFLLPHTVSKHGFVHPSSFPLAFVHNWGSGFKIFWKYNLKSLPKINSKTMEASPNGAKLYRKWNMSCAHGFQTKNSSVSTKINILIKNATETASHQTCWPMFVAPYKNKFREYEKILLSIVRTYIDLQQNAASIFSWLTVRKTGTVPI